MTSRNSPEGGGRDPGSRPGFGTGRVARPQCPGLSSNLYLPPTVLAGAGWRTRRAGGRAACELLRKGVRPKAAARGLQLAALPLSPPGPSRARGTWHQQLQAGPGSGKGARPRACCRSLLPSGRGSNLLPTAVGAKEIASACPLQPPLQTSRPHRGVCPQEKWLATGP